jgi:hypothetical protein
MEAQGLIDARTAEDAKMQPLIFRPEKSEKKKT